MTQDAGFPHHPDVKPHRTERTGKTHQEISELKNRQMGRIEKLGRFPLIKQFWGQLQTQGNNKMLHLIQMFTLLRSFIGQRRCLLYYNIFQPANLCCVFPSIPFTS